MTFNNLGRTQILSLRRQNRPIGDLFARYLSIEPGASDYIAAIHVLRLCFEAGLPFSQIEVRRFAKKSYIADMGGSPPEADGFYMTRSRFVADCLRFSGRKRITFRTDIISSKKLTNSRINSQLESPRMNDNSQTPLFPIPSAEGGK